MMAVHSHTACKCISVGVIDIISKDFNLLSYVRNLTANDIGHIPCFPCVPNCRLIPRMSDRVPFLGGQESCFGIAFLLVLGDNRIQCFQRVKRTQSVICISQGRDFIGAEKFDLDRRVSRCFGSRILCVGLTDQSGPPSVTFHVSPNQPSSNMQIVLFISQPDPARRRILLLLLSFWSARPRTRRRRATWDFPFNFVFVGARIVQNNTAAQPLPWSPRRGGHSNGPANEFPVRTVGMPVNSGWSCCSGQSIQRSLWVHWFRRSVIN
mmetsp:Transcript_4056/g.11047  ORF Transcript_4056/g.11047 Transcript_4056/m.11047 type:complete len:266 (-) Transcript_4056:225-1022(-)